MAKVTLSLTLDTERDRRLLRWLDSLPKRGRSEAIREALSAQLGGNGVITLGDVYRAVKNLEGKIKAGVVVQEMGPAGDLEANIPADVLANLDSLGL